MDRFKSVWLFFTKKDDLMATCNTCGKDYNYKTSSSNLRKHWMTVHGKRANGKPSELSDSDRRNSDTSDGEPEKKKKPKATWSYFEVPDSDKYEAICKICQQEVPFTSSSDLAQHVQEQHDEKPKDSDEEFVPDTDEYLPDVEETMTRTRFKSKLWKYFTPTNDKMAVCLLCKKLFNYSSTITNLRRHLNRKHRGAGTPSREDSQKVFRMSADGTLYEIETEGPVSPSCLSKRDENEEDPVAMNTIYLNEEELNLLDEPVPQTPKKKQKIHSNFTKVLKERVRWSRDTCSEERERPRKQVSYPIKEVSMPTPNTMSSLDYFGQYVVSLLKELPKPVSDQLQSVIIKQILTSKMALETDTVHAKYEIKISQKNDENETKIPEPVTYTVVKSNTTADKVTELTESVVQE